MSRPKKTIAKLKSGEPVKIVAINVIRSCLRLSSPEPEIL